MAVTKHRQLQMPDPLPFATPEDWVLSRKIATGRHLIGGHQVVMEGAAHLKVPLIVEAGHGQNWAAVH